MTAPTTSRADARRNLNHLRRGEVYRATTRVGTAIGEYLGMEVSHGDRSILLRHGAGTESIALRDITSIQAAARRS